MRFLAQLLVVIGLIASLGAKHVSTNFVVEARSLELAKKVAETAEEQREQLAIAWFGHTLKPWFEPCKIKVQDGPTLGAGGKTKFKFDGGEVYGWDMFVQGTVERILDSVIPHEVNHTILACYFRRPVPRWADEGACSLFEHESEVKKQQDLVNQLVNRGNRIPLRVLLEMKEYPVDMQNTLALYAEGYSLTNYLVQARGRATFLRFLNDAHHQGWDAAFKNSYGKSSVEAFEREWTSWVLAGSPSVKQPAGQLVAKQAPVTKPTTKPVSNGQVRAQSPTPDAATALKLLRQQIRDDKPVPPREELAAPNPRDAAPREIAARSSETTITSPTKPTAPVVEEPKAIALKPSRPSNELRPLELIRIDDRASTTPMTEPQRLERSTRTPPPRLLRETRLREEAPTQPQPSKLAPFAQFPSRTK